MALIVISPDLMICTLLAVVLLTLMLQKILNYMQTRPSTFSPTLFLLIPTLALILWVILPSPITNLTILFLITLSSLAVYSMLGPERPPSSEDALTKTLRYGLSQDLIILNTIIFKENFILPTFTIPQEYIWLTLAVVWYISTSSKTNRFILFPLSEYANTLLMNTLTAIILLGLFILALPPHNSTNYLIHQATLLTALIWWIWISFPLFRYDDLEHLIHETYHQSFFI